MIFSGSRMKIQKLTDDHIKKVEGIIADKEKEILEF